MEYENIYQCFMEMLDCCIWIIFCPNSMDLTCPWKSYFYKNDGISIFNMLCNRECSMRYLVVMYNFLNCI